MTRIRPISAFPATESKTYPDALRTDSNDFWIEGLGVIASLDADSEFHCLWQVPDDLPDGTAKLELIGFSYDASGDAKINPYWKSVDFEESMDLALGSLNAEGVQTITWSSPGDAHVMKQHKVNLDADTVVAGEFIMMRLVLTTASWTLNQRSIWLPNIIWE